MAKVSDNQQPSVIISLDEYVNLIQNNSKTDSTAVTTKKNITGKTKLTTQMKQVRMSPVDAL